MLLSGRDALRIGVELTLFQTHLVSVIPFPGTRGRSVLSDDVVAVSSAFASSTFSPSSGFSSWVLLRATVDSVVSEPAAFNKSS